MAEEVPQAGDLVIFIPKRPITNGGGPYYVLAEKSKKDSRNATLALLGLPYEWIIDLPIVDLEVVGHFEASKEERKTGFFSAETLKQMDSIISAGRRRLYECYPALKAKATSQEAKNRNLVAGQAATGPFKYEHTLEDSGGVVVWRCKGHHIGDPNAPETCAQVELDRRRQRVSPGGYMPGP